MPMPDAFFFFFIRVLGKKKKDKSGELKLEKKKNVHLQFTQK